MRQKILVSQASFEGLGDEIDQEQSLDRIEQLENWTESRESKQATLHRLAWLAVKLCNSFVHRWFNLCEVSVEVFYAMLTPRFFAGMEFDSMTASQETVTLHSGRLVREQDYSRPEISHEMPGNQSNFEISWKTPWLYFVLLLLIWLLLF